MLILKGTALTVDTRKAYFAEEPVNIGTLKEMAGNDTIYTRGLHSSPKTINVKWNKFSNPITKSNECPCTEDDYECDYEFIEDKDGKESCLNVKKPCNMDSKESKIMDEPVEKDCSEGIQQGNGTIAQIYNVRSQMKHNILNHFYFGSSEAFNFDS
ncbi:hypothetical protein CONCODRAFT_9768 [Conidiobolus coronatus NRRL 28638]|uniref:Sortilin C-terminal domain-containing protein n=1 Tax=Conidiobolus coronatus (strain ATCC 28846 / CBS 209.66 / NRRL 28638) TaxID=796925 RepID=A0A137NYY4_CONC2|nr:hypothetical protein CONCODRAFT_9768 [Conidiobolus coronatus NRRL 28638]|eukprot:KXN68043.1 hypothetical protein CONCODRAFT_9768 [Conidiobolus coronatus NRRL 28638]